MLDLGREVGLRPAVHPGVHVFTRRPGFAARIDPTFRGSLYAKLRFFLFRPALDISLATP